MRWRGVARVKYDRYNVRQIACSGAMTDLVAVRAEACVDDDAAVTSRGTDDAAESAVDVIVARLAPDERGDGGLPLTAAVDEPAVPPPPPPAEPTTVVCGLDPARSSHVDDQVPKGRDVGVVQPMTKVDRSAAAAAGDAAKPGAGERTSTGVGRAQQPAARHALPSAVAAPRATGKHRLPPVLVTSAGQGHGLERTSPLPLVVGAAAASSSTSLTGGTRLGDLGLSQPPPPLNLSVAGDEAVNMKVVGGTTTTPRSAVNSINRSGMYITACAFVHTHRKRYVAARCQLLLVTRCYGNPPSFTPLQNRRPITDRQKFVTGDLSTTSTAVIDPTNYSSWVIQICPKQIQDSRRPPS